MAPGGCVLLLKFAVVATALVFQTQITKPTLASCDKTFLLPLDSAKIHTFEAPTRASQKLFNSRLDERGNLSLNSSQDIQNQPTSMHCLYKFVANEGERVLLNFLSFRLRGDEPDCAREYLDVYLKFKSSQDISSSIVQQEPNGRFCTSVAPRRIVSLHNMVVLSFYSELEPPIDRKPLFSGSYDSFHSKVYDQIGPPDSGTLCTHTIYSSQRKEGEFQSITYPGVYVKGLKCSYKFVGEPGQRVRLEFLDVDLFSGGSHCPFDSLKIIDGHEETDPVINTICGSHRNLIIFSTREHLLLTFSTLERNAEIQNRGFSAYFEFSDNLVNPSFIQGPHAKHIRGSECDQRILSHRSTKGIIISPDPKHHTNAICRYIFEGLQTSLDSEKVLLRFIEFDLKLARSSDQSHQSATTEQPVVSSSSASAVINELTSGAGSNASTDQCNDNYVRLYTDEQKPDQRQDPNDYDYVFCSNETPQASIESDAASLLLEYNSGSIGGYFKAEYTFLTDYRIPGLQNSSKCDYNYRSDYFKAGVFNSPRHPSWYINNVNCTYNFMTKSDEILLIEFNSFRMSSNFSDKLLGYNEVCRGEDSVEIYELEVDGSEQKVASQKDIGVYCGTTTPGPMMSFKPLKIIFKTNEDKVNYGFSALYNFYPKTALTTNEFVTNCGGNILANLRHRSGTIDSPDTYRSETYEKRNHICSWNITARPSYRIALDFTRFQLEGSQATRGCSTASIRLLTGKSTIPTELCGNLPTSNGSTHQHVSENEWISITFISTKRASGSDGFSAVWTEIKKPTY